MYIVGRKANQGTSAEVLDKCGSSYNKPPTLEIIMNNMINIYGGTSADYSILDYGNSESIETDRIFKQDAVYDLEWTDTSAVSGVNFDEYDTWNQLDVSASKSTISADGIDTSVVTWTVYESDGETIDTLFTSDIDVEIKGTSADFGEQYLLNVSFTSGVGITNVKKDYVSTWRFPLRQYTDRTNNLKIKNQIYINIE